jgi:hypothetical protein
VAQDPVEAVREMKDQRLHVDAHHRQPHPMPFSPEGRSRGPLPRGCLLEYVPAILAGPPGHRQGQRLTGRAWPSQDAAAGFADPAARRYSALMRWASSSWSSRMTMRQAASTGVPWSTSSRARAAMRSW